MSLFPYGQGGAFLFTNTTGERLHSDLFRRQLSSTEAMSNSRHVAFAQLSVRGAISDVSENLAAFLHVNRASLLGARITDLVPTRERRRLQEDVEQALSGRTVAARHGVFLCAGEREEDVEIVVSPMRGELGIDGAYVLLARGVTTRSL